MPYPIKYEAKLFTPPPNEPWLEIKIIPSFDTPIQTAKKVGGILQININHPLDAGALALHEDADKIASTLRPKRHYSYNDQSFFIARTEESQILTNGNYHVLSLSVYYRAAVNY